MILYLLIGVLFLLIVFLGYFLIQKLNQIESASQKDESLTEWLKSMQQSLDKTNDNLNQAMRESNRAVTDSLQKNAESMNDRLDRAAEFIAGVKKEVGQMAEIGRGMKDLQEFLRSPKLRGNIGEMILRELLAQMLPPKVFSLQYSFKSGEIVDAVIKTGAGLIPVDSKFPMENFRKMMAAKTDEEKDLARKAFTNDVRKHIRAITSKYILPEEGTLDYALMYIPSEAVYYEIANDPDLFDYAGRNRILAVSPATFYAYMKAILMSFEGQKVEERARQILTSLGSIEKDYEKINTNLNTLSRHLTNAHNQMNGVTNSFNLLGQKLTGIRQLGEGEDSKANLKALKD